MGNDKRKGKGEQKAHNAKRKSRPNENVQHVPILEKLNSAKVEDRKIACAAIANIVVEDDEACDTLVNNGLLRKLVERLSDECADIRITAAGALRNVSLSDRNNIRAAIVKANALPAIFTAVAQVSSTLAAASTSPQDSPEQGDDQDERQNPRSQATLLAVQLAATLWHLCESCDEAVVSVSASVPVLRSLASWLHFEGELDLPAARQLPLMAAQALEVVSQENAELCATLGAQRDILESIQSSLPLHAAHPLIPVLIAESMINFREAFLEAQLSDPVVQAVEVLIHSLTRFDPFERLQHVWARLQQSSEEVIGAEDDRPELHQWKNELNGTLVALESLTNITAPNPADGDEEDPQPPELAQPLVEKLVGMHVLEVVAQKCRSLPASLEQTLPASPSPSLAAALSSLRSVQLTASRALCNLVPALPPPDSDEVLRLTTCLFEAAGRSKDSEIVEAIAAALSVLADRPALVPAHLQGVSELSLMKKLLFHPSEAVQIHIAHTLSSVFAHPHDSSVNMEVGRILLDAAQGMKNPMGRSAVIDAIFDIYSEDTFDENLKTLHCVERLKSILAGLQSSASVKGKGALQAAEHARVLETIDNLARFVDYKQSV